MQKPILKKLQNGVRILILPQKESVSVTAAVFVEAGSAYESKNINGISHFLEHMCFKGTEKRPSAMTISTELENLGASYNAFTDFDLTGYHVTVAPENFDKAFDVISDMYINPLLDTKEIEKEKGVIIEEIRMYEDLPRFKVSETLGKLMHGNQPAGWSIAGTEKTVKNLSRNDIHLYRDKHYIASKTIVVIAGNITADHAYKKAKESFNNIKRGKNESWVKIKKYKSDHVSVVQKKLDQSHFMIGFHTVPYKSQERLKLSILATILGGGMGSRLFQRIREEMGAAYYINSVTSYEVNHGGFYIQGGINNEKLSEVFSAVINEIKNIKNDIKSEELVRAKEFSLGNFLLSLETSSDKAFYYGYQMAITGKVKSPEETVREIKSIKIEEIKKLANKYLTKDNFNFALVGPYSKSDETEYKNKYKKLSF